MTEGYELKPPVALTCPLCGGSVAENTVNTLPYYTCHIGHRFAGPDFDEAQFQQMEQALDVALRALNERAGLCRRMVEAWRAKGLGQTAEEWEAAAQEADERAEVLRQFVEQGWRRPDAEGRSADDETSP